MLLLFTLLLLLCCIGNDTNSFKDDGRADTDANDGGNNNDKNLKTGDGGLSCSSFGSRPLIKLFGIEYNGSIRIGDNNGGGDDDNGNNSETSGGYRAICSTLFKFFSQSLDDNDELLDDNSNNGGGDDANDNIAGSLSENSPLETVRFSLFPFLLSFLDEVYSVA